MSFFFLSSGLVAGTSGRDGKRGVLLLRNYYLLSVGRIQWARMTHDDVGYLMLGFFCANDISFFQLYLIRVLCVACVCGVDVSR